MPTRPVLLGVLWVGVTAGLTVTSWLAVQLVATQVGADTTTVLSADAVRAAATDAATSSPEPSATPTSDPDPSKSPSHTPSASPSSSKPGPTTHTRTLAVPGGTVAASCTGSTVALRSAQPKDGWTVRVKDRGPERVVVEFRTDEQRTEIEVRCSAGVPRATTEQDDHGGGGDGDGGEDGDGGGHGSGDSGDQGSG